MSGSPTTPRIPADLADTLIRVPLALRQLTIKTDPGGAVRCRWFTDHPQRPVVRQERFASTREAAESIARAMLPLARQDFAAWYQTMDVTVIRWRRGAPGFRPRSPAVRQDVTRCALAVTEVAMGYAELAWWCDHQGAAVAVPASWDWLTCAMNDRAADRALGCSTAESVAARGAALAKRLTDGAGATA